jgi:hypothetical protein
VPAEQHAAELLEACRWVVERGEDHANCELRRGDDLFVLWADPERFLDPTDPESGFEPGRAHSWGQIPKAVRDVIATDGEHLGDACNGRTGFLAGGGEE